MIRTEVTNAKIEYTDYNIPPYTAKIVFSNKQNLHIFVY